MKKIWLPFLVVCLVILGILLSPYYALYRLKSTYEAGDYSQTLSYVDFHKVQTHTKQTLSTRLDDTLANNKQLSGLALLFPDLKDELANKAHQEIEQAVHEAITPQNLEKLLAHDITPESKKFVAVWAVASDYVDYETLLKDMMLHGIKTATANQEPIVKERIIARFGKPSANDIKARYCGINCFKVEGGLSGQSVGATLYRDGLIHWKIEQVALP